MNEEEAKIEIATIINENPLAKFLTDRILVHSRLLSDIINKTLEKEEKGRFKNLIFTIKINNLL